MPGGLPKYVDGALVRPALTNMWYVTNSVGNTFAVCAAHSLVRSKAAKAGKGAAMAMRIPGMEHFVTEKKLEFRIPSAHLEKPSHHTDFAIAAVGTLPADATPLPLYKHRIEAPTHLTFLYSHRFNVAGRRIPVKEISLGVHSAVAIADGALYRCQDTGFPGFSGAAGLMMPSSEPFSNPALAALFVGIADPALPAQFFGDRPAFASVSKPTTPSGAERGRLSQHLRGFLGLDALESRLESRFDGIESRMLTKDDVKAVIRATQRHWGVAVPAHHIEDATRGTMATTPLDEVLRTAVSPTWLEFEQRLADSEQEWQGDSEAAAGSEAVS